jgi:hypothetical protein
MLVCVDMAATAKREKKTGRGRKRFMEVACCELKKYTTVTAPDAPDLT